MPRLNVNGRTIDIDAEPDTPLLWVLREQVGLTATLDILRDIASGRETVGEIVAAGASIGAYNALAVLCRYPDVFREIRSVGYKPTGIYALDGTALSTQYGSDISIYYDPMICKVSINIDSFLLDCFFFIKYIKFI